MENRRPRIAYLAPNALQDRTSGAAISLLTMLRALSGVDWQTHSLSAAVFDRPPPARSLAEVVAGWGLPLRGNLKGTRAPVWRGTVEGVDHMVVHLGKTQRMQMSPLEEALFLQLARRWLAQVKPDVVLTMGGLVLDAALQREARRQGAAVVFYLANGSYNNRETFAEIDQVITNSGVTAQMYAQRLGIEARNVGVYVDTSRFIAVRSEPRYITFINPVAEKGVTLFLRLVAMARTRAPDLRFLVVESRGTLAAAIERLKLDPALTEHVTVVPRSDDMREVYAQTRALLCPSFWFEAAGRVLVEAIANGIPVVATNRGGIPETLAGGGTLLPVPTACMRDHWHMPTEEEAQHWWDALNALHCDSQHYEAMSAQAREAARHHDLSVKARALDRLLRQTIERRRAIRQAA
ncbi:glycosyltransferase family 4 protein [Ramlibacter tataouinensis]|uniref:Glycosyl transferase family 1 domain-containing protein n=1 Tax=Ramlibacter tataouinensis TaxID=94132 RepID=A0A127JV04_9BURK|nr:glycosyltransferase family 4 protein [Ramlibacter tataouinensis]AMO23848.1 hypothetical protein UC35_14420 [Ramlibacter tataouinensis]